MSQDSSVLFLDHTPREARRRLGATLAALRSAPAAGKVPLLLAWQRDCVGLGQESITNARRHAPMVVARRAGGIGDLPRHAG